MKNDRIEEIAAFNERYFGANRIEVISRLFQAYPELCFVSCSGLAIDGYIMCRKAEVGCKLGPCVCDREDAHAAKELLVKCMSTLKRDEKL
jgi:hypothetical protein